MNQSRLYPVETLELGMLSGFLRFNVIEPEDISKIHRYVLNKERETNNTSFRSFGLLSYPTAQARYK